MILYTCPGCGGQHLMSQCAGQCACCEDITAELDAGRPVETTVLQPVTPASTAAHVLEGICQCVHIGLKRVAMHACGLSSHRVEAAAAAVLRGRD